MLLLVVEMWGSRIEGNFMEVLQRKRRGGDGESVVRYSSNAGIARFLIVFCAKK